jgi:DNA-binding transcriptional LysR family regulator
MELRQVRYFQVVAEEENFHRAAERLHIAQPALSRQIQSLEGSLGVKLFSRQSRGIRLSDAGHAFVEEARRILADVSRAEQRVRRVGQGRLGVLQIGFNEIAARRPYLPSLFQAVRERFPDIEMRLTLLASQPQLDALRTGQIDAGFLFHRPVEDDGLRAMTLDTDDYAVAMPATHRLARKRKLFLSDFRGEPFVMMSPSLNRTLYDRLMVVCVAGGLVPRQVHEANHEYAIVNLVAAGMGLAFLNRSFSPQPMAGVVLRRVLDLSLPVQLDLVWQRENETAVLARFIETVAELRAGAPGR